MLRLLALTDELHAIVAEAGASIHINGSAWDFCGTPKHDADIHFFGILPPGMSALDFAWTDTPNGFTGKGAAGDTRITVYLDADQRHLVADLLPAKTVSA